MVSYGKVESPWPVIGTVLVIDGMGYVSAGRTQGSDGGIVVRAFDPATGEIAWSHAITPSGEGVSYRELRRNDLMLQVGDTIQLMLTRMDAKTGELRPNLTHQYLKNLAQLRLQRDLKEREEAAKAAAKAAEEARAELMAAAAGGGEEDEGAEDEGLGDDDDLEGLEDEETGDRVVAAEEDKEGGEDGEGEEAEDKAPDEIAPSIGLEGFSSWHWTRLGNRKYGSMTFGNLSGSMISWGREIVCANAADGRSVQAFDRETVKAFFAKPDPKGRKWQSALPEGYQATAVVVCRTSVVIGGGVYPSGSTAGRGFIRVLSADRGETTAERVFPAPLTHNGLAVSGGKIYATFTDGSAVCLGPKPGPEGG